MANAKGRSGYTNSTIEFAVLSAYAGGGVAGATLRQTFLFAVRERNKELVRPRQDTTDSPYGTGVGGPVVEKVKFMGYFKGEGIPDASWQEEFIYVNALVCLDFEGIILVERFAEVGVIDGAIHYEIEGTTDSIFTNTNIVGA